MDKYDFCGWATRNDLKCSDGRVIRRDAFKDDDGKRVPVVWNHRHDDAFDVLGHADLENRPEGVFAFVKLNEDTTQGQNALSLVRHGDINAMSICANKLKQNGSNVLHGVIREISLVLAGANPGAMITDIITHSDDDEGSRAMIYTGMDLIFDDAEIEHAEEKTSSEKEKEIKEEKPVETAENKRIGDLLNSALEKLDDDEKDAIFATIGAALEQSDDSEVDDTDESSENSDEGEENTVSHNIFENGKDSKDETMMHAEILSESFRDAKKYGSLRESVKEHALEHGIEDIDQLFPDAKATSTQPTMVTRDMDWVTTVMNGVHHVPFARIKSLYADLTEDEARAKGYIKGKYKKEQVFGLLKRTTQPTTVYKKQKLDRDDMIDAEFDIVPMIRQEMRMMLNEELARAYMFGDGRPTSSDDKINEQCIRPVWTDDPFFTINATFTVSAGATSDDKAKAFIRAAIKARKDYKGSGTPIMLTSEDILTDMLLTTDSTGRDLYTDEAQLARKLRVSRIITCPIMDNLTREVTGKNRTLFGLILNLNDYNVGANRGGQVSMFDDFDIDYNAQKYLIETRCSGSLVKPYSAIAVELESDPI